MNDALKFEQRAYETKDGIKLYRFLGRELSGYPKQLQFDNWGKWENCPNINIHQRIQLENTNCLHHWSRLFATTVYCKNCGVVTANDGTK